MVQNYLFLTYVQGEHWKIRVMQFMDDPKFSKTIFSVKIPHNCKILNSLKKKSLFFLGRTSQKSSQIWDTLHLMRTYIIRGLQVTLVSKKNSFSQSRMEYFWKKKKKENKNQQQVLSDLASTTKGVNYIPEPCLSTHRTDSKLRVWSNVIRGMEFLSI